jgi:DedD protein
MPKPISDEELQLKVRARRRIIGAVALVIILVLLLPMLLDSRPRREAHEITVSIPAPDKGSSFNPSLKPANPPETARPMEKSAATSAEAKAPVDVKPAPPGEPANAVIKSAPAELKSLDKSFERPKPVEAEKPVESKKTPETGKLANAKLGKFVVQLGVFSNRENAQQVEDRLKEIKIRHYREMLKSPPGAIRVRAGPYPTRGEAESALAQLKLSGINGGVVVAGD